jgi:hypothetical protein
MKYLQKLAHAVHLVSKLDCLDATLWQGILTIIFITL